MTESLRSIDDSVQWLHNFERLQQLQTQVVWPNISELEPKSYIPDVSSFHDVFYISSQIWDFIITSLYSVPPRRTFPSIL